jgi:hypothetical protein
MSSRGRFDRFRRPCAFAAQVVGVTTKKHLLIAPPAALILMRELAT